MATVRIYKVAELLGTTSQEVSALLKRDHGIEVKSASSTIEEVVARQFVDRLARQRNIVLPCAASCGMPQARGARSMGDIEIRYYTRAKQLTRPRASRSKPCRHTGFRSPTSPVCSASIPRRCASTIGTNSIWAPRRLDCEEAPIAILFVSPFQLFGQAP